MGKLGVRGEAPRSRRQVVKIMHKYLSIERFTVTTNAQNTLQLFQFPGGGSKCRPLAHACGPRAVDYTRAFLVQCFVAGGRSKISKGGLTVPPCWQLETHEQT